MKNGIVVKAIVVNSDEEILLPRRSKTDTRRPLQWDIPGGFYDNDNETFPVACTREIKEESGLEVNPTNLKLIYACSDITEFGNVTWLFFITKVTKTGVTLSYEHSEYRWVSLDQAIKLIDYPRQNTLLKYVKTNNLFSLF